MRVNIDTLRRVILVIGCSGLILTLAMATLATVRDALAPEIAKIEGRPSASNSTMGW